MHIIDDAIFNSCNQYLYQTKILNDNNNKNIRYRYSRIRIKLNYFIIKYSSDFFLIYMTYRERLPFLISDIYLPIGEFHPFFIFNNFFFHFNYLSSFTAIFF